MSNSTVIDIKYKDKYIGTALYSYGTLVAAKMDGTKYLTEEAYSHSKTTSKHINEFFGRDRKTIEAISIKTKDLDGLITDRKLEVKEKMEAFERATAKTDAANDSKVKSKAKLKA